MLTAPSERVTDRTSTLFSVITPPPKGLNFPHLTACLSAPQEFSGLLEKRSSSSWPHMRNWDLRFFELRGHYLVYYPAAGSTAPPLGCIDLRKFCSISVSEGRRLILSSCSNEIELRAPIRQNHIDENSHEKLLHNPSASEWLNAINTELILGYRINYAGDDDDYDDVDINLVEHEVARQDAPNFRRALCIIGVDDSNTAYSIIIRILLLGTLFLYVTGTYVTSQVADIFISTALFFLVHFLDFSQISHIVFTSLRYYNSFPLQKKWYEATTPTPALRKIGEACTASLIYVENKPPPCLLSLSVQFSPAVISVTATMIYVWLIKYVYCTPIYTVRINLLLKQKRESLQLYCC